MDTFGFTFLMKITEGTTTMMGVGYSLKKNRDLYNIIFVVTNTERGRVRGTMKQHKECSVQVQYSRGSPAHLFVKPASHHNWDVEVSFNSLISLAKTVYLSLSCTSGVLHKGKERNSIRNTGRFIESSPFSNF